MNWLWDNIRLKKADRAGMFSFLSILFFLLLIKWYLVVYYQPEFVVGNVDVYSDVEYTWIEEAKKENNKSSPKFSLSKSQSSFKKRRREKKTPPKREEAQPKIVFEFDPNTLSPDSLLRLGLSKYAVGNIQKYRSKGGFFNKPDDLKRIYGLEDEIYNSLHPFIKIKKEKAPAISSKTYSSKWPVKKPSISLRSIDINLADTIAFKSLKGIGSVYANRIVKFRNSLGGYFATDQIKDVWGISDSLFTAIEPYLTIDATKIEKKNINALEKEMLVKHPYIDWKKAKVIINYKEMHGEYKSMNDFEKLHGIEDAFVDTLKHYFVAQ